MYSKYMIYPLETLNSPDPGAATYYSLDDGRIWSINEAKFVSTVPEN